MSTSPARPKTVAVILAGGTGQRIGMSVPKQLLKVAGKTILEHTLAVFETCDVIDEIYVTMTPGYLHDVDKIIADEGFSKVMRVLEGGGTRADSTRHALEVLGEQDCNILLHDAVRPLVDQRVLRDCVEALDRYEAIDVAIPSSDTLITVDTTDDDEIISSIPERSRFRRGQTPQGFRLPLLREAYARAAADPAFTTTDDCGVVREYLPEVPIHVVAGTEHNMKVTHPIDVYLADRLFQLASRTPPRVGSERHAYEELRGKTLVVFGGSYGIGAQIVRLASEHGATVASFSRSATGTHVEDPEQVDTALREAYASTGRIDYVINTAGILHKGPLEEFDAATIEQAMRVNYLAPVQLAKLALPYLRKTSGSMLLYTSSSYTRGRADYSLYSSSKAAIVNLTQALADEWTDDAVRINCVNPERTATPMRTQAFGTEPADTLLTPDAVAHTSLDVLLSSLTGQIIDVRRDGSAPPLTELYEPGPDLVLDDETDR